MEALQPRKFCFMQAPLEHSRLAGRRRTSLGVCVGHCRAVVFLLEARCVYFLLEAKHMCPRSQSRFVCYCECWEIRVHTICKKILAGNLIWQFGRRAATLPKLNPPNILPMGILLTSYYTPRLQYPTPPTPRSLFPDPLN